MIALVQRVLQARVDVAGVTVGAIAQGLLVLVCAEPEDTEALASKMIDKLLKLRIFSDPAGKMNHSVQDVGGGLLIVSQFTLAADVSGGNRPSFTGAAAPDKAQAIFNTVLSLARSRHPAVASGSFGADMQLHLVNDGPVTIPIILR